MKETINCYFCETGYFIKGPNEIEIVNKFHPGTKDILHHLYFVLGRVCWELIPYKNNNFNVIFYNDTRIIDELNGETPLDNTCGSLRTNIRQFLLPLIPGLGPRFEKLSKEHLMDIITTAQKDLLSHQHSDLAAHLFKKQQINNIKSKVQQFKENWDATTANI